MLKAVDKPGVIQHAVGERVLTERIESLPMGKIEVPRGRLRVRHGAHGECVHEADR